MFFNILKSLPPNMKIAAIYDIHGNLPALEAVLKEIEQAHDFADNNILNPPPATEVIEIFERMAARYT